jgi:GT2 family glycosyltransferase
MAKPLISVIIVNYNEGGPAPNFPGVEVIVVDNSPPNPNLGFSRAVNMGVSQSHGKFICLLNPDAQLTPGSLDQMLQTLGAYHDRAIVAPRLVNQDGTPQPSCYARQTIWNAIREFWFGKQSSYSKYLPAKSGPVHAAVAACWLLPRAIWDELGGLDEKFFLYFEDLDFCDRASRAGIPIIYDRLAKVIHQHGSSAKTNPNTAQLFLNSAKIYHGSFTKTVIDLIIKTRDLFIPPVSIKKILGTIILYTAFILAISVLGYFLLPARYAPSPLIPNSYHSNFLIWSWANFDGEHYLGIAQHGYRVIAGQSEYAFFPIFPLLINLLTRTGLDAYLSAHLIVLASSLGFIFVLLKWSARYTQNPLTALWLVLLSPGSIFLSAIYSEPLFLFLAVLTFYFADRGELGKAVFTTALATATRVNGIFLVLFLLLKFRRSLFPVLGLSGLFAYMTYLYFQTGNVMTWYHAQSGWEKSTATLPWVTAINYGKALTTEFVPDLTHLVVGIEVVLTLFLLYLLILFWHQKKLDLAYKLYALGSLALPLATGSLGSMPRFSLTLFPLFLMIPLIPRAPRLVVYTLFAVSCMLGTILFTRGYWYA